jgi:TPR repeat protein
MTRKGVKCGLTVGTGPHREGDTTMARYELLDASGGALGQVNVTVDMFYDLGMMYSTGRSVPVDLVAAHKWFNIAAVRGNSEAIRLRREIAAEMSEADVAAAQRAARDWLTRH